MPERTEAERAVRDLIALNDLDTVFSSFHQKLDKIEKDYAQGAANYVKQKAQPGNSITARLEVEKELKKARVTRAAINKFKKDYPKYGGLLEGYIGEDRWENENYLAYCLNEGYKISVSEYITILRKVGFAEEEAMRFCPDLISISERLREKKEEGLRKILIGKL